MRANKQQERTAVEEFKTRDRERTIRVLYDYQHWNMKDLVEEILNDLNGQLSRQKEKVRIDVKLSSPYEFYSHLTSSQWDFVMMHVGSDDGAIVREARKSRDLSNAILVAESTWYPQGKEEILETCDFYIMSPIKDQGRHFVRLLQELRYIPKKFEYSSPRS